MEGGGGWVLHREFMLVMNSQHFLGFCRFTSTRGPCSTLQHNTVTSFSIVVTI